MLPVKPYTVAVPANGSLQMQVTGRYLRVNACTNPITVSIDGIGTLGAIGAGQGIKLPASVEPFQRLMFTDASGAINNITFIVADADFVDNTVIGSVNVIDGGKSRTLANQAFLGVATASASAANLTHVLLNNPSAAKNCLVKAYRISADVSTYVVGGVFQFVLGTTLIGNLPSKLAGGAVSASQMLYNNAQAVLQVPAVRGEQVFVAANSTVSVVLQEPIVLSGSKSLVFAPTTVNCGLSVALEIVEEAVT